MWFIVVVTCSYGSHVGELEAVEVIYAKDTEQAMQLAMQGHEDEWGVSVSKVFSTGLTKPKEVYSE